MVSIAIPTNSRSGMGEQVAEHFGRCKTYTFIDENGQVLKTVDNTSEHMGGSGLPPELMKKNGADILLCKTLGPRALELCGKIGIDVYIGEFKTVKEMFDAARDQFNKIIEKYAENDNIVAEAVFHIGYSYENEDKWKEALAQYKKIMNQYPITGKGLDIPLYIAKYYEENHEPENMIAAYKEAVAYYDSLSLKNPSTKLGFSSKNLKAQCYIELKDWESAIGVFDEMIESYKGKEDLGVAMIRKALIYRRGLNDIAKAKETLQQLIKEYPESRFIKTATAMLEELK